MRRVLDIVAAALSLLAVTHCGGPGGPTIVPTPPPTVTPVPTPVFCPSPSTCPPARVWKIGIRECESISPGGTCLVDTTPFWLGGRCNAEDRSACGNSCGSYRECEPNPFDPTQFPSIEIVSGDSNIDRVVRNCTPGYLKCDAPGDNSYQFRFVHVVGRVKARVCWPIGAKDADGVLLDLSGASCGEVVLEPTR